MQHLVTGLAACYVQLLLEQVKPKQELVYDFAKQNRNAYGVFVLPNEIRRLRRITNEDSTSNRKTGYSRRQKVSLDAPPVCKMAEPWSHLDL